MAFGEISSIIDARKTGITIMTAPQSIKLLSPPCRDAAATTATLLAELSAYLRDKRTELRQEWAQRISEAKLLTAMTEEEVFIEAAAVYDRYVEALETDTSEALESYALNLSERIVPRGVETEEVVGIVLLLRDVLERSLFVKYQHNFEKLNRILDAYEPAANRIANMFRRHWTWRRGWPVSALRANECQVTGSGERSIPSEVIIAIESTESVIEARRKARHVAADIGFTQSEATMIAAAISELARNIVQYAGCGEIRLRRDGNQMLYVVASDRGPGIADVRRALQAGYSTSGGRGLGLVGVQRIADEFEVSSDQNGTTVTFGKRRHVRVPDDPAHAGFSEAARD